MRKSCNILYFEKDDQARHLAKLVGQTRGDTIVALESLQDRITSDFKSYLRIFKFAICTFDPSDDIQSYRALQTVMQKMPVAILTNGDPASTAARLRSIGIIIPSDRMFDKSSSTFTNVYTEMKKSLGLKVMRPAMWTKLVAAGRARLTATGTHRALAQLNHA